VRLYKRGDVWHVAYYDSEGKRVRESTKCTSRAAAEEFGKRRELRAAAPDRAAEDEETLERAFTRLIKDRMVKVKLGNRSQHTVSFYEQKSGHWLRLLGKDYRLSKLTAEVVDDYSLKRDAEGAKSTTIAKELVTLRAALRLAVRARTFTGNPLAILPVGFSTGYVPRGRWLPPGELQSLLSVLTPDRAARAAFMVATGAELGATDRAERGDSDESFALVRGTKRESRWRKVPILTEWQKDLLAYALQHAEGDGGMLFRPWLRGNIIRDIKAACERADIDPCTPNDLRRTFAQWLRRAGLSIELIAPMMGHTTTKMVQLVYGKLDEHGLREQVGRALGCDTGVPEAGTKDGSNGKIGSDLKMNLPHQNRAETGAPGPTRTGDLRIRSPRYIWPKPSSSGLNRHHKKSAVTPVCQPSKTKGGSR
jgi:integrase